MRDGLKEDPPEDMPEQNRRSFPVGSCGWIAPWMFGILKTIRDDSGDFDQIKTLVKMLRKGYPLRKGYGIMDKGYFQNVLQLGHLLLNVANDAASDFREPVAVCPIAQADFVHLADFNLYFKVVESYCKREVYPNNIFPALAFANPYVVRTYLNVIAFMERHKPWMLWTEIQNGFAQTSEFLFNSAYSTRALPEKERETLIGRVSSLAERLLTKTNCCEQCRADIRELTTPACSPIDFYQRFNALVSQRNAMPENERERFDYKYIDKAHLLVNPIECD